MGRAIREIEWGQGAIGEPERSDLAREQRTRLFAALADVVAERGLRGASATRVARQAGISRAVLTEQFGDLDSCFAALLDDTLQRAGALIVAASLAEDSWEASVIAGLEALLVFLESDPSRARACLLESMTALPTGFESRARALGELGRLIEESARERLQLESVPSTTSEATIAAVLGMLRKRLLSGEAPPFLPMLGPLTGVVVGSFLGPEAACDAARRGARRAEELDGRGKPAAAKPAVEIPSMLRHGSAHRMRSCMRYVAASPGASNQAVADGIGVAHGGQVSALLSRLHDAGMLAKECGGPGKANSWRLTPYGATVESALRTARSSSSLSTPK